MDYRETITRLGDSHPVVHACLDLGRFNSLSWEETLSVLVINLVKANDNLMERIQKLLAWNCIGTQTLVGSRTWVAESQTTSQPKRRLRGR